MTVVPKPASVRPRVIVDGDPSREPKLLEELVERRLTAGGFGLVFLRGPRGSGKTTALSHLAHVFRGHSRLLLNDGPPPNAVRERAHDHLIVSGPPPALGKTRRELWTIAPWTRDDRIEYLLAAHPGSVTSIARRAATLPAWCELAGQPALWARVLDELARDEALIDALAAVVRVCALCPPNSSAAKALERQCVRRVLGGGSAPMPYGSDADGAEPSRAFAHVSGFQLIVAARALIADLGRPNDDEPRHWCFPPALVAAIVALLPPEQHVIDQLVELAASGYRHGSGNILSILHDLSPKRVRDVLRDTPSVDGKRAVWKHARIPGAFLSGLKLRDISFASANLCDCELRELEVRNLNLAQTALRGANLERALLAHIYAPRSDWSGVRARGLRIEDSALECARFVGADLTEASFVRCRLRAADLSEALLVDACLEGAMLVDAEFRGASMLRADLSAAELGAVDLRSARLDGAVFGDADLFESRWEGVIAHGLDLRHARLERSLLSGSRLRESVLRGANLASCGLADVDWEGADLRDVDLTNASFHLGSTRSGMLAGAPAMWGSMTGYYARDAPDLDHLAPEMRRKANLKRCNLIGARVLDCDFYLVDLRGAQFTPDQEAHFRACSAILDPPGTSR